MRKTYIPFKSGDVVIYPKPFWIDSSKNKVTHLTGYTYDRMVPILFAGPGIQSGTYAEKAHVVDIAPTISYILGIIPPAMSEGKVLGSAIPTW